MIHPTFRNVKRLLDLPFKAVENKPTRISFDKYYMPLVEIKGFHALTENKQFFGQIVKSKQETYEKMWNFQKIMSIQQENH